MTYLRRLAVMLLLLPLAGPPDAAAQFASVRGRVVDATDGQPLPGANVLLDNLEDGGQMGVASDDEGVFFLTRLTPGRYVLAISYIGYLASADTLVLDFGQHHTITVDLPVDQALLDEVIVEQNRISERNRRIAGASTIRASELERVPMPDVSADLAAYLLTMPGFVSTGDRGGQLFVRGGTPTQNLVLLDGMPIYQPFHIVGFYSAFPANIVSHADVYAGGFGARYGGRISSVIDVSTRNGNKQRAVGSASLAPFLSAVRIEVPLYPGKVSVLASARESIIERIAPDLLGQELPFRFGDRFLKVHAYLNQTSSFSATALRTFDEGNIGGGSDNAAAGRSTWRNHAYGLRYLYLPPDRPVMTQFNIYSTRLSSTFRPAADQERDADVAEFEAQILFLYLMGESQFNFGIFAGTSMHEYDIGALRTTTRDNVTTGGMYFDAQLALSSRVRVEPSLRVQSFSKGIGVTLGPRFRILWQPGGPNGRQQFSAAWGLYHQQVVGLNNEQNVSNVFTIWAPTPSHTRAPRAMHLIAGTRWALWRGVSISLEGYYKEMANIAFPRLSNLIGGVGAYDLVDGLAQGVDVRLEVIRPSFYGNINYSLASVTYAPTEVLPFDTGEAIVFGSLQPVPSRFSPPHDRRHQLNAMTQMVFGSYRLNLRWQFGSGLPFTRIDGYYEALSPIDPDDRRFHTEAGTTLVARAAPYTGRLPSYHRLDVSAERAFQLKRAVITAQAGVINVYDRANIFDFNFFTGNRVDQLPLIPSIGLEVEVR